MRGFHYIGLTIQILRQRRQLTIDGMIACMGAHGCPMAVTDYTAVEKGIILPPDGRRFLRAVTECLALSEDEVEVLVNLWALAVLQQELGEDMARECLLETLSVRATAS